MELKAGPKLHDNFVTFTNLRKEQGNNVDKGSISFIQVSQSSGPQNMQTSLDKWWRGNFIQNAQGLWEQMDFNCIALIRNVFYPLM